VRVLETSPDGRAVRISETEWVDARDVHVARPAEPPPALAGAAPARWIDVDLAQQVLVAYEGTRAVYATLVSTGKQSHSTPAGVFRIQSKAVEAAMRSDADDPETYRVEAVPFVMAFLGDFALHGVYWHDGFGERRSHGCVNLAPSDAEWIFGFVESSAPEPPAGDGSASLLGSVVRIRRR
jgi:lipoprotein-anchoring transpeptidase ErfK/SrfK